MASVPHMRLRPAVAAGEAGTPAGTADADLFARLLAATPKGATPETGLPDAAEPGSEETATPDEGASPEELVNLLTPAVPPTVTVQPAPTVQPGAPLGPTVQPDAAIQREAPTVPDAAVQPGVQPASTVMPAPAEAPVAKVPARAAQPPTTQPIDELPSSSPLTGPVPAAAPPAPTGTKGRIDPKASPVPSPPPALKAAKAESPAPAEAPDPQIAVEPEAKRVPPAHAKATTEVRPDASPLRPVVASARGQDRAPVPTPVKTATTRTVERATSPVIETSAPAMATAAVAPQPFRAEAVSNDVPTPPVESTAEPELDLQNDLEWLDRLARDIARAGDGATPLRFRLHPQTLGHLNVEIAQTDQGTAVRLTADTEAARALIADAQPRLLAEARAQGVRIAEAQVDLAGSGGRDGADSRRHDEPRTASPRNHAAAGDEREEPPETSDRFA